MNLKNKNIAFCLTGSFCTFKNTILQMKELVKYNVNIIPIMSYNAFKTDTKYRKASEFVEEIEEITNHKVVHTIKYLESVDFNNIIDIMIIAPCTGNTLAKLNNGIVDTPVLMAVKAHLRNEKPIVIGISTVDGLSR